MNVEPIVTAWLHAEAPPRARPGLLDATLERVAVTPQARELWKAGSSAGDSRSFPAWIGRGLPRGVVLVAMLALLAAALVGAALIGAQLLRLQRDSWHLGSLVYTLDGDVYVANSNGESARRVLDGVPWNGAGPSYGLGDRPWAPDGKHLLLGELVLPDTEHQTLLIADVSYRVVATIPGAWVDASWAPDSRRLASWVGETTIGIYGTDGTRLVSLGLPADYVRYRGDRGENLWGGLWAPDGRSISVYIHQPLKRAPEIWQLPMDGSVPRRLAEYESVANGGLPEFSGDGSRVAGVSSGSLIVANADGTDRRAVGLEVASSPIWSPTGTHIAYIRTVAVASQSTRDELRVVDVSSGQDRVVAQLSDNGSLLEWSPTGDEIMFMLNGNGEVGPSSLYAVNVDTGHWTALAYGAGDAAWQWIRDEGES
jgi:hypothetical protein